MLKKEETLSSKVIFTLQSKYLQVFFWRIITEKSLSTRAVCPVLQINLF